MSTLKADLEALYNNMASEIYTNERFADELSTILNVYFPETGGVVKLTGNQDIDGLKKFLQLIEGIKGIKLSGDGYREHLKMYRDTGTADAEWDLTLSNSSIAAIPEAIRVIIDNNILCTISNKGRSGGTDVEIARYYTGSDDVTDYPVGHSVLVRTGGNGYARNASATIRQSGSWTFSDSGTGSILTGTWRARGFGGVTAETSGGSSTNRLFMFQRTE